MQSRLLPTPILLLSILLTSWPTEAQLNNSNPVDTTNFDKVVESAVAARDKNDTPRAIALYTQAEQLRPEWSGGWWFLGLLYYSNKSWLAASNAFTHYIDLAPEKTETSAQAYALRGLCEFEASQFPQSLADLERAIAQGASNDPHNENRLRYREALALSRLGRFEESLSIYSMLAKAEESSEIGAELKLGAGLAGLRSTLLPSELPPDEQELYDVAGDATLRFISGDQKGAHEAFANLFRRFPKAPNAHYLYGFLMLPVDPDVTVTEYKRELDVAPDNVMVAWLLAWVLLSQNKPALALPYAQKAVAEAPELAAAQLMLGRSLAETGDLFKGIEHLEESLRLQPQYLEIHVALATAYASAGRSQDARREREHSLLMAQVPIAKP